MFYTVIVFNIGWESIYVSICDGGVAGQRHKDITNLTLSAALTRQWQSININPVDFKLPDILK